MKREITLGNLLSILVPIFVLLMSWGISISSRLDVSDNRIDENAKNIDRNSEKIERVDDKIDENFKEIQKKLDQILIQNNRQ